MNNQKEIQEIKKLIKEFRPEGVIALSEYAIETLASLEDRLKELEIT